MSKGAGGGLGTRAVRASSCLLARAHGKGRQAEEGLSVLAETLTMVSKIGERSHKAELYRLKGELTLQSQTSLGQVQGKSKTGQGRSEVE
ncbi:MAG TPA: hypothetical protein VNN62_03505 [Methylomirabilota bacterium]|nr:hypothetical protein [Methylomirabilota bacterium]